jgi:hypothetical protein
MAVVAEIIRPDCVRGIGKYCLEVERYFVLRQQSAERIGFTFIRQGFTIYILSDDT